MRRAAVFNLVSLLVLFVAGGATCPANLWRAQPPAPVVFGTEPTFSDIAQVINANRNLITGVYSTNAKLSGSGFPALRTSVAIGSPRHVRMRAGTGITGQEMDLGSNEELFWVWIRRDPSRAVYYGRYDEFTTSAVGHVLPVRPEWLVEALGLVTLDPTGTHQGPFRRTDGQLEVHTQIAAPEGTMTRVLVIDGSSGWIRQQHLLNDQRQVVASAINSNHFRDAASGAIIPRRTDINWPAANMKLTLEFNEVQIGPLALQGDMWAKPDYAGFANVDVTAASMPLTTGLPENSAAGVNSWQRPGGQPLSPLGQRQLDSPGQPSSRKLPPTYGQQPYRTLP